MSEGDEGAGPSRDSGAGQSGTSRARGKQLAEAGRGRSAQQASEDEADVNDGRVRVGDQDLCIGSSQPVLRDLPELGIPLGDRPLVEVRGGGLNLESDCARSTRPSPAPRAAARLQAPG
jgi:hypothetical protein